MACAHALDDLRLRRINMRAAKLLSTVAWNVGMRDRRWFAPLRELHRAYKLVHWIGSSARNYYWTADLFRALCAEHRHRFDLPHHSEARINAVLFMPAQRLPRGGGDGGFPHFYSGDIPRTDDIHANYRLALHRLWRNEINAGRKVAWTRRGPPNWIAQGLRQKVGK